MSQSAPYPQILQDLVDHCAYRAGWTFKLEDIERDSASTHEGASTGLTFIGITGTVTYEEGGGWSYGPLGLVRDPEGHYAYEGAMDAYHPEVARPVYFYFPVPPATYDERSWQRWMFDRLLEVERHEAMEHFSVRGDRPYGPSHGPGNDPYLIREVGIDLDQKTSFRGVVNA